MTSRPKEPLDREILAWIKQDGLRPASEARFNLLALRLFAHQYRHNSHYRKFCQAKTVCTKSIDRRPDIPAMPVFGFKELDLRAFPARSIKKTFRTSGTTFQKKGRHYFDTLRLYQASAIATFRKFCLPDKEDLSYFFLTASPGEMPDSSLSFMMGMIRRSIARNKGKYYVRGGRARFDELLTDLERSKKKVFLLCTALLLKSFLDYLKDRKIDLRLKTGSRLMETGGFKGRRREVGKEALYAACRRRLGIESDHCIGEYGMTELSSQFYSTALLDKTRGIKRGPVMAGPSWTRTVVMDPRTGREADKGRPGLLRHYDLANRGSVLAIQTEDLGRARDEGFDLLGRLSGSELRGCSLTYEDLYGY